MSSEPPDAVVVLCTVPEDFDCQPLAHDLLQGSMAACVQLGPVITSMYRWKGALEQSRERLMLIKTRKGRFSQVESAIRALHPYDVPEIVALPVVKGHRPYLAWIAENTNPRPRSRRTGARGGRVSRGAGANGSRSGSRRG